MTSNELHRLYLEREEALKKTNSKSQPLNQLSPEERAACNEYSRRFRNLDRLIVAELKCHPHPVDIPGATLWLTSDKLNFIATFPGTNRPLLLGDGKTYRYQYSSTVLYRYNHHHPD